MNSTGFVVILAYPDTIVRPAHGEFSSKIWPLFGVGGKHAVQAGHAALLLISKETNKINYFDFGRYVTSDGYGRVRSEITDCEVEVPMKAEIKENTILNLDEILLFLERSPEKTHGEGRMVVSVNSEINYLKALDFIEGIQNKIEVPYGAFVREGTNCARFVTDTIIEATVDKTVRKRLKITRLFTPSPISNIIKGKTNGVALEVYNQKIKEYTNTSISKEHRQCFFNKVPQVVNNVGTLEPNLSVYNPKASHWLGGIGSGAWFEIKKAIDLASNHFRIIRKCPKGSVNVDAIFEVDKEGFSLDEAYQFVHGSNCKQCILQQNNVLFYFTRN